MDWKADKLYQAYLAAGFGEWQSESWDKLKLTPYFVQKRIMKGHSTLFFITVYVYVYPDRVDYQPEANFKEKGIDFEVILANRGLTPAQIELFFRRLYRQMNCEPYE